MWLSIKLPQWVIHHRRPADYKREKEKGTVPALRVLTVQEERQTIVSPHNDHCNKIRQKLLIDYLGGAPMCDHLWFYNRENDLY